VTGFFTDAASRRFLINVAIAFAPAVVLGVLFGNTLKTHLFKPIPVAAAFIAGGLIILWAERRKHTVRVYHVDDMLWQDAFKIGCLQCLALIPGTSRSGATIIGGLFVGLSRKAATEFSFFLAIPTLLGAGVYSLYKERALFSAADLPWFGAGTATAFLSAFVCVRWLLRYIAAHDFTGFAWYRIVFGVLVIATAWLGLVDWTTGG
jgi:undecaprenyl-diphosphatase